MKATTIDLSAVPTPTASSAESGVEARAPLLSEEVLQVDFARDDAGRRGSRDRNAKGMNTTS